MEVVTVEVTDAEADKRVDHVLVGRLGDRTRSQIQRLIKEGRAQVGAKTARASTVVRVGDVVTLEIPAPVPAQPRAEDLHVNILYDDVDLIVVSKPAGMVVHPAAGHTDGTLVNALLHHVRDLSTSSTHRRERRVTGCVQEHQLHLLQFALLRVHL